MQMNFNFSCHFVHSSTRKGTKKKHIRKKKHKKREPELPFTYAGWRLLFPFIFRNVGVSVVDMQEIENLMTTFKNFNHVVSLSHSHFY